MAKAKKAQIVDPTGVLETDSDDLKKYIRIAIFLIIVAVGGSVGIGIMNKKQQAQIDWIKAKLEKAEKSGFTEDGKDKILKQSKALLNG